METTVVYWGYIGGLYRDNGKENGHYYSILGLYKDNGKENGNYYSILGLYGDNGKENGNYYSIFGLYWWLYRENGKENENHWDYRVDWTAQKRSPWIQGGCLRWTPHPVIVTIRDNRNHIILLLYSYYTTITGSGVLIIDVRVLGLTT